MGLKTLNGDLPFGIFKGPIWGGAFPKMGGEGGLIIGPPRKNPPF